MEDWDATAAEVAAALAEVGFTATLTRPGTPTGPSYDPTPGTPSTHDLRVMQDSLGLGMIDGTTIRAGDLRLMCAAEGIRPTTADRVTVQGVSYAVALCEPFAPGGVDLYYDLLLRA